MEVKVGAERNRQPLHEWEEALLRGGRVGYGSQPSYRIVWGYSNHDRYRMPERWLERWHVEWWHPLTREYERLATIEEGITKEFMSPTVDLLRELVDAHRLTVARTSKEIKAKIEAEMAAREAASVKTKEDLMEDATAAFPLKTWMPVSGPMTAETRRRSEYGG